LRLAQEYQLIASYLKVLISRFAISKMILMIKVTMNFMEKSKVHRTNPIQMLIQSYFLEARSLKETVKLLFAALESKVHSSKEKLKALELMKTLLFRLNFTILRANS
jgi:hypothetical protein